jgi:hypothetical protein
MQISHEQVYNILQIVEVYGEVQAPLAERKAHTMKRIAELLNQDAQGEQLQHWW